MKLFYKKSLRYLFFSGSFFLSVGCSQQNHEAETEIGSGSKKDVIEGIIAEPDSLIYDQTYTYVVPSNDRGIYKTTLKLATKFNKFSLKEEYSESNSAPNIQLGKYNTERGFETDENATLYILNAELPESERLYFLRETGKDGQLLQLSNEKKRPQYSAVILNEISSK